MSETLLSFSGAVGGWKGTPPGGSVGGTVTETLLFLFFFPSQTNVICLITINFFKIIVIIIIFISKDNKRCAKCNKKVTNIVNRVSYVCNKRK